jgi:hypothetical protein
MSRFRAIGILVVAGIIAGTSGCNRSRIHFEKTETIAQGTDKTYTVDGPKSAQKVKVEVTSKEPVNIKVFLEKEPTKFLAEKSGVKEASLEVDIPEGAAFTVSVFATKETEVTVKVNNI